MLLTVSAKKRQKRLRMPCEFVALILAFAPLFSNLFSNTCHSRFWVPSSRLANASLSMPCVS